MTSKSYATSSMNFVFQQRYRKQRESSRPANLYLGSKMGLRLKNMSAYKAFKAQVPIAWSPNLYITLVRGMPGTRKLHRRTLEALRLRKCNRTVMQSNTPSLRGMLQQVKRLVVVETEEMYKARKKNQAKHQALRPPLVVNHTASPPTNESS